jgi:predicted FMN-binding regulatory protein PaiB
LVPLDLEFVLPLGQREPAIERLEPKFKLSQNRVSEDRDGVRRGLLARTDEGSRGVLELMRRLSL